MYIKPAVVIVIILIFAIMASTALLIRGFYQIQGQVDDRNAYIRAACARPWDFACEQLNNARFHCSRAQQWVNYKGCAQANYTWTDDWWWDYQT